MNAVLFALPFVVALAFGLMSAWFQKHVYLAGLTLAQQSFGERLAVAGGNCP